MKLCRLQGCLHDRTTPDSADTKTEKKSPIIVDVDDEEVRFSSTNDRKWKACFFFPLARGLLFAFDGRYIAFLSSPLKKGKRSFFNGPEQEATFAISHCHVWYLPKAPSFACINFAGIRFQQRLAFFVEPSNTRAVAFFVSSPHNLRYVCRGGLRDSFPILVWDQLSSGLRSVVFGSPIACALVARKCNFGLHPNKIVYITKIALRPFESITIMDRQLNRSI